MTPLSMEAVSVAATAAIKGVIVSRGLKPRHIAKIIGRSRRRGEEIHQHAYGSGPTIGLETKLRVLDAFGAKFGMTPRIEVGFVAKDPVRPNLAAPSMVPGLDDLASQVPA